MRGKGGWIRILEATIAVLIVSGAIIAVYSSHPSRGESIEEQAYSLQRQILDEVAMDEGLRLAVLNVETDLPGDSNYDMLDEYVAESIPDGFGYLLRVCILGDERDFCKMDGMTFTATQNHDIFVEDVLVSAEIGNGSGEEIYLPKKVRLFFWEGGWPPGFCRDGCVGDRIGCSADSTQVLNRSCVYNVTSGCFNYGVPSVIADCNATSLCVGGECIYSPHNTTRCTRRTYGPYLCDRHSTTICGGGPYIDEGDCDCNIFGRDCDRLYRCYTDEAVQTACGLGLSCPYGYNPAGTSACVP